MCTQLIEVKLRTHSNLVSLSLTADNDSFDFSLISLATDGTSDITLTGGTGVTL